MNRVAICVIGLLLTGGVAEAQAPTFGSPYVKQRVELTDETTGNKRLLILEKRADGDYNIETVGIKTGDRTSGVLRSDGNNRFSGDIFDAATATFRQVVVIEREDGDFGIEQFDYSTRKRVAGVMRCDQAGCQYERR